MPVRNVLDRNNESMTLLDVDGYFLPNLPFFEEGQHELEFRTRMNWKAREGDIIICAYPKSDVDGYFLPNLPFFEEGQHEVEFRTRMDWKAREDDIIICAYPKSGTHWTWELICMLLNNKAELIPDVKEMYMLEVLARDKLDAMTSPRVLNTHLFLNQIPHDFINKKCKLVFIDRNPKDAAVSFFNHHKKMTVYNYEGKWENYLNRWMDGLIDFGSWFDYTLDWEKVLNERKDLPIHVMNYEDMKEDCLNEVGRLAKFLGVEENQALFKEIVALCHFDNLKKEKDAFESRLYWKNDEPGMYRKGITGDWKNWFTVKQNEEFDKLYNEKMKYSNLKFKYMD